MTEDNPLDANRALWDQWAELHSADETNFYRIAAVKAGGSALHPLEIEELGPHVAGKTLLHLQCHFGLDTISWLRHGAAAVTGADFSGKAIEAARALAAACGESERAAFVQSNIDDLPDHLSGTFDIVYTSYGVLFWLPDLTRWAEVIAHFLAPGGLFYIAEYHPFSYILDDESETFAIGYPYFDSEVLTYETDSSYAAPHPDGMKLRAYEWMHTLGEIVTVLAGAGLRIDYLHEFPLTNFEPVPYVEAVDDRHFRLAVHADSFPLTFSLLATKLG